MLGRDREHSILYSTAVYIYCSRHKYLNCSLTGNDIPCIPRGHEKPGDVFFPLPRVFIRAREKYGWLARLDVLAVWSSIRVLMTVSSLDVLLVCQYRYSEVVMSEMVRFRTSPVPRPFFAGEEKRHWWRMRAIPMGIRACLHITATFERNLPLHTKTCWTLARYGE